MKLSLQFNLDVSKYSTLIATCSSNFLLFMSKAYKKRKKMLEVQKEKTDGDDQNVLNPQQICKISNIKKLGIYGR